MFLILRLLQKAKGLPYLIHSNVILITDMFFQLGTIFLFICSKPSIYRWTHFVLKMILGLKPKQIPPKG